MDLRRITRWVLALAVVLSSASAVNAREVDADVIKRARARPNGTDNIGVYVQTRREYRKQWERFGFTADRPAVDFTRRRLAFVATTESSSCPLRFRRVELHRADKTLVIHLSVRVPDDAGCTDDLAPRSFVISVARSGLPRGDLQVRSRRR